MVQIDFSVLFLFLAATVAPVAARPVNQPNPPHHHTPPARANSLPSSTPHHTPPAPPIPPTHHQTPPVVHQPNPGPDHQIHHAQNNPVVIHESPGAPSSETPRINFEQFIQRFATIQVSQGSHPPNPVPPTHHQTPPVVHQPSNPHAENNRIIHSPRPTLPPRAYSMLLRDSPTHKTPSPDHAPTNPFAPGYVKPPPATPPPPIPSKPPQDHPIRKYDSESDSSPAKTPPGPVPPVPPRPPLSASIHRSPGPETVPLDSEPSRLHPDSAYSSPAPPQHASPNQPTHHQLETPAEPAPPNPPTQTSTPLGAPPAYSP